MSSSILSGLNPPQAEAVQATEGPVLVLAGAGSGKTRTIVHRISWLINEKRVLPGRIVAVTFTNKAAQEMRERIADTAGPAGLGCVIKTYHSLGLYLLRELTRYIDYPSDFTIWDDTDQQGAINNVVAGLQHDKLNKTHLKYLLQKINGFKDNLISPTELPEKENLEEMEFGDILQEVYHLYEQRKIESRAMDFSDLLYQTVKIMQAHPEALEIFHHRYHYFLVDEYQDTNHSQYMLIHLLSKARQNLCVVGDDDQAIYTWRGADINNILDFNRDFPQALVVKLEENYRSTQSVLDLANDVIKLNRTRMPKELWTSEKEGKIPELYILNSDLDESRKVAEIAGNAIQRGVNPSEIGILYRVNSQSRLIEEALLQKNIKYKIFGGVSFFGRKEVKDVLSYLRFLVNPFDEASMLRLINNPSRGIGDKSVERLMAFRAELGSQSFAAVDFMQVFARIDESGIGKKGGDSITQLNSWMAPVRVKIQKKIDLGFLLEDIMEKSGLRAVLEEEDRLLSTSRMENIQELKNSMIAFQRSHPDALLTDYLQEISLFSNTSDMEEPDEGVCLMTVHNAKGLEFEVVCIVGLDDGIFPHFLASGRDDGEEERRLLYVAITRARRELYMTRAKKRMMQGFVQTTHPSVFIAQMSDGLVNHVDLSLAQPSSGAARPYPGGRPSGSASGPVKSYRQGQGSVAPKPAKSPGGFSNMIDSRSVSSSSGGGFHSGDKVHHPTFGVGKIFRIEGSGDAAKAHIMFNDGKSRKFILKYTRLEKA